MENIKCANICQLISSLLLISTTITTTLTTIAATTIELIKYFPKVNFRQSIPITCQNYLQIISTKCDRIAKQFLVKLHIYLSHISLAFLYFG